MFTVFDAGHAAVAVAASEAEELYDASELASAAGELAGGPYAGAPPLPVPPPTGLGLAPLFVFYAAAGESAAIFYAPPPP